VNAGRTRRDETGPAFAIRIEGDRAMRIAVACLLVAAATVPALAQTKSYEIPQPKGTWQVPGEIKQPTGPWQKPGDIQVPKGIQAVRATVVSRCEQRLSVVADALFDFDKANLRTDAEETLAAAAPEIAKLGGKPSRIEGHTDGKGSDAYNLKLSEARASTVREWLAGRGVVPAATPIKGYGKSKPVAPNTTADGKDDPQGRQKNRRVEVVFDTCT
jgi:outer membrane protein OmpA-like peptidoglycan-associated protein